MGAVLSAWLAEVAIITLRSFKAGTNKATIAGLPLPSQYLATFALYGSLSLVPKGGGAARFAGALAWGFTAATALNYFNATNPLNSGKSKSSSATTAQKGTTP